MPRVCFGCNAHLLGGEHLLCTVCRHDLPLTEYNFNDINAVDRTFYGRVPIAKASALLFFSRNGLTKNLLHHLKYKNQQIIGDFLGNWMGKTIAQEGDLQNIDYIVPVPLHPKKLKKRGYNQVDAFAKQLAKHLNANVMEDALIKTVNRHTQTKRNRLLRFKNHQEVYVINPKYDLSSKNILLVDDIITTGATIESCATALHQHRKATIYVASMAFTPKLGA